MTNVEGVHIYGSNRSGQCGRRIDQTEDTGKHPKPYQFDTLERFGSLPVKVSCGFDHTLVLLENGKILAFGCGWDGQLGQETFQTNHNPNFIFQDENVKFIDVQAKGNYTTFSFKGTIYHLKERSLI